jgi:hypothetical protein
MANMKDKPDIGVLNAWPVYVTDTNVVYCNKGTCDDVDFLDAIGRRVDFGDVIQALRDHIVSYHYSEYDNDSWPT